MEELYQRDFFNALHSYIQRVVTENPKGDPLLNVTESPTRGEMVAALNRLIDTRIQNALKERERRENIR